MRIKVIIRGLIKMYFPSLYKRIKKTGTGGTDSALYCYSVWLRHLILLDEKGMVEHPKIIAEIGPGDSLGIGLNALITGATTFYAFDIIKHSSKEKNIKIFEELVLLYKQQKSIPYENSKIKPKLKDYSFPKNILTKEKLNILLNEERLLKIKKAIIKGSFNEFSIKYVVPWDGSEIIKNSIDLIYSQAVMEHVSDVKQAYVNMYKWLKDGGYMSHEIDYSAHETHSLWYGHWQYSDWIWNIINYGRLYDINRYPNSFHVKVLKSIGFKVVYQLPYYNEKAKGVNKSLLKRISFNNEDLITSSCYIIAKK